MKMTVLLIALPESVLAAQKFADRIASPGVGPRWSGTRVDVSLRLLQARLRRTSSHVPGKRFVRLKC